MKVCDFNADFFAFSSHSPLDSEPGAQISKGYYENFVRIVLDAHCQGWPFKLKDDPFIAVSLLYSNAE
jgi:hypothetical protein